MRANACTLARTHTLTHVHARAHTHTHMKRCLMKLGLEGVIRGIEADTSYFTGNQVSYSCSKPKSGFKRPAYVQILNPEPMM